MRLARTLFDGEIHTAVEHEGSWVRLSACIPDAEDLSVDAALTRLPELHEALTSISLDRLIDEGAAFAADTARFAAPLTGARNIIAVGLNYHAHAAEIDFEAPAAPLLFAKWSNSIAGPNDDIAVDPQITTQVDYEAELALIISKDTHNVAAEDAYEHIAGYLVSNDVSARNLQFAEGQWTRAKSFNGFCPIGPWVTTSDGVPDPGNLKISCSVNGEVRQESNTSYMIHKIPQIIAFASRGISLRAGDVILTGTPSGVAMSYDDPPWLQPGDVIRTEIEGLGALENRIVSRSFG